MRTITCTIAAALLTIGAINAQENVDVKKETTTKKVVVKDTNVETMVVNDVETEESVIEVDDAGTVNQDTKIKTQKSTSSELVKDEVAPNTQNDAMVKDYQKKEAVETDAAIMEQRAAKKNAEMNSDQQDAQAAKNAGQMQAPKAKLKKIKKDN